MGVCCGEGRWSEGHVTASLLLLCVLLLPLLPATFHGPPAVPSHLVTAPRQDGKKKEGSFYVWSESEIRDVLGAALATACSPVAAARRLP